MSLKLDNLVKEEMKLPENWKWVKLGEVCNKIGDIDHKMPKQLSAGYPYVSTKDFTDDFKISFEKAKYISEEDYLNLSRKIKPEQGDIIFPRYGTIGKNVLIDFDKEFLVSYSCAVIKPNHSLVLSKYVYLYSLSPKIGKEIKKYTVETTQANVGIASIKSFLFPFPSLNIQQAIVSKIEELFSELDKGIENLRTAQQQLKTYRQSVLKWAFEGKLTNENVKEGELPEGWKWKTIKEISSLLGDGLHGTPNYTDNGDYYFINGNNLSEGKILFKDSTKRVGFEEYQKHKKILNETTILVSINGTLGNTAFYNSEKVILGKSACYFNLNPGANKHYIRNILTSQRFLNYAEETATGSTIPNVSLKAMREFKVPLPSIEEQNKIIQEIESRLSVADKMEESITQSLQQAEALRQSILKKAFEGKLI